MRLSRFRIHLDLRVRVVSKRMIFLLLINYQSSNTRKFLYSINYRRFDSQNALFPPVTTIFYVFRLSFSTILNSFVSHAMNNFSFAIIPPTLLYLPPSEYKFRRKKGELDGNNRLKYRATSTITIKRARRNFATLTNYERKLRNDCKHDEPIRIAELRCC